MICTMVRIFNFFLATLLCSSLAVGQARPTPTITPSPTPIIAHTPIPPSSYTVPASTLGSDVATMAALKTELAKGTSQVIVVANGTYDDTSYINNTCRHKVWARNLHGAVFNVGFNAGANFDCGTGNTEFHGLKFNISTTSKTLNNDAIHNWGALDKLVVEDLEINGNNVLRSGIWSRPNNGFVARRLKLLNFTDWGLYSDGQRHLTVGALTPAPTPAIPLVIEDIDVDQVAKPTPGSGGGTSEMCIWAGDKATTFQRLRATDCGWSALWLGSGFRDTTVQHMTFDTPYNWGKSTAVYFEHYTLDSIIQYFNIINSQVGFQCEWIDSPPYDGRPGCNRVIIRDGYINATCAGLYLDEASVGTSMYRTVVNGVDYCHTCAYLPNNSVDRNMAFSSGNKLNNAKTHGKMTRYEHLNNYKNVAATPIAQGTPNYCRSF